MFIIRALVFPNFFIEGGETSTVGFNGSLIQLLEVTDDRIL